MKKLLAFNKAAFAALKKETKMIYISMHVHDVSVGKASPNGWIILPEHQVVAWVSDLILEETKIYWRDCWRAENS